MFGYYISHLKTFSRTISTECKVVLYVCFHHTQEVEYKCFIGNTNTLPTIGFSRSCILADLKVLLESEELSCSVDVTRIYSKIITKMTSLAAMHYFRYYQIHSIVLAIGNLVIETLKISFVFSVCLLMEDLTTVVNMVTVNLIL